MAVSGCLRIAVIAHVRHPVAPPFRGGMEAHAWHLTRGLMARGHKVHLLASGDSDPSLPLMPIVPQHYETQFDWHRCHGTEALNAHLDTIHLRAVDMVARGGFDVIHNNSLHRFPPRAARALRQPMVTSLHVPPFATLQRAVHDSDCPWHVITVTSAVQRGRWWAAPPETARVVANGIDPDDWPFAPGPGAGIVWAGRIAPTKAPGLAAQAARRAGLPLTIYGAIEDPAYFRAEVAPHLGGEIRYGGHLSGAGLAKAYGEAAAMAFTPVWDEPFGLAAIEAMACGLPVAAFDSGAVREVIGPCGRFATPGDVDGLAAAMLAARKLPRAVSRARVTAMFSAEAMLDGYEAAYRAAIAARNAPAQEAHYTPTQLRLAPDQGALSER